MEFYKQFYPNFFGKHFSPPLSFSVSTFPAAFFSFRPSFMLFYSVPSSFSTPPPSARFPTLPTARSRRHRPHSSTRPAPWPTSPSPPNPRSTAALVRLGPLWFAVAPCGLVGGGGRWYPPQATLTCPKFGLLSSLLNLAHLPNCASHVVNGPGPLVDC